MVLKYRSGEPIERGDRVRFHGQAGRIELVAAAPGDPETAWFIREYGGGVMILDEVAGRTFVPADQLADYEDLEFLARAEPP